jgi:NAD(P)-dependent dehydrogenase (short-subunit alcohol dehydrogenase family)
VTGAAGSGMGRSIALTLAREDAKVVVNYKASQASAETIVEHIVRQGTPAIAVQADIFCQEGCTKLVEATIARFGRVDICVIGPGAGWHPETVDQLSPRAALEDLERETAPILNLMPLLLPGMYERNWGRFIAIAMHPYKLSPAYAYNLGKAARLQSLLLAYEQAWPKGVTMNVIAPGPVPAIERFDNAVEQCDHGTEWRQRTDISPQDIAEGVAFLCSESGRFITGCVLSYLFHG